ncbi:hypothetical protein EC988_002795, partial [Linderina pennispora]
MLRSAFDNIPESIVDQIIGEIVDTMCFRVGQELFDIGPIRIYSEIPAMNQMWSRIIDRKKNSFA